MKQSRCVLLFFGIGGFGALLLTGCIRTQAASADASSSVPVVGVTEATRDNLAQKLVLTAEFRPYQEVDVHAKVAGYIRTIRVDVGDHVKQGEVLATLEIPELRDDVDRADEAVRQHKAELEETKSAHEAAHLQYTRLEEVVKSQPNLVAEQEVDDAEAKDQVTGAQVLSAEHDLDAARDARKKLQTMYAYSTIVAPFTGVITKRYADTGAMIQAGTASANQSMPVVRVSQNNPLRLIVPVSESAVSRIHINTPVEVYVPTLNKTIEGKVARFADTLDLDTRTMDTEIDVANPKLELIPGMYAQATITLEQRQNTLTVPVEAVDHHGAQATVYRVAGDGAIQERRVGTGIESPFKVEITSGLKAGDLVVISGRGQLHPGEKVMPKKVAVPKPQQES